MYRAINLINHKPYAIKLEPHVNGTSSIEQEYYILKQLMGLANIVKTHWFGCEVNFNALVLDLLGSTLQELLSREKKVQFFHCISFR